MKYPILASVAVLAMAFGLSAQKAPTPAPKTWVAPKTPWGDPDLQGTWTSDDCIGTPLNRPANLGDRLYYTEQELAQREGQLARQQQNDLQEFVASDARVGTGPPGHGASAPAVRASRHRWSSI